MRNALWLTALALVLRAAPVAADPLTIAEVAAGSKDHTTLVTALKAADLVDSLKNPGPFTVFAPNNDAFAKLPKGTVEGLLKPEKIPELQKILQHHVTVSTFQLKDLEDGLDLGMADGTHVIVKAKDGKVLVGDAAIVASVPCSNGIIHVVDGVILPPAKK